jgi:hypothetical protein
MPILLRKQFRLGPYRMNLSKTGVSHSVKVGPWSWNTRARRHRIDLPGPLAWTSKRRGGRSSTASGDRRLVRRVAALAGVTLVPAGLLTGAHLMTLGGLGALGVAFLALLGPRAAVALVAVGGVLTGGGIWAAGWVSDRLNGDQPAGLAAAVAQLAALPVRVEDTGAHYDREAWGEWVSTGGGCDTRELVLVEQGAGEARGGGCRPVCPEGQLCWTSPYDGARTGDPRALQVDHRVPLAEAQRSGARAWTAGQRRAFYNDRRNLVAVTARVNTSKGDRDPGAWRPPARAAWCGYATAYVATKTTYRLTVDQRERDALRQMLGAC